MKTIVFLTTQTSATSSIWRIIKKLTGDRYKLIGFDPNKKNIAGEHFEFIPKENTIFLHNRPDYLKFFDTPSDYKFIVNFRDPRDRLCNSYYWMQQHPHLPGEAKKDIEARAAKIQEKGINSWVTENVNPKYERSILSFVKKLKSEDYCVCTYASLCLDFDNFIFNIAKFLDIKLEDDHWKMLENERVENISSNSQWIGDKWKGSDVMPGRYIRELNNKTINYLGEVYDDILRDMATIDQKNSTLYLNNKNKNHFSNLSKHRNLESPDILREVALAFEKSGDIHTAFKIMEKAHSLRPDGPFIRRKLDEYRTALNYK
ncbi:sulfotransferase domain-containing protein [Oceanimonas smirnovii]|uniref:sulfotransferase domain-containing protein n=1 Tax=Oceanimonas smirnovii TaxID=264574 RepID=UPI003FD3465C